MDRLPLPLSLPFSPDLLWRYPLSGLSSSSSGQPPSSPLLDVKQQLPGALGNHHQISEMHKQLPNSSSISFDSWRNLPLMLKTLCWLFHWYWMLLLIVSLIWSMKWWIGPDPRTWAREDVVTFLRWCEREFDLPGLDLEKFQMNGENLSFHHQVSLASHPPAFQLNHC